MGPFSVAADGRTVRIDPSWLRETTGSETLENLTIGGITNTDRLSTYLWDGWYTYLRNRTEHRSLRRFAGYVQRHDDNVDLDRYSLESRPLPEGMTVSVSGELHVDQGEPVLRGTDETPLLLSDEGFDGHRRWVRRQMLWNGGVTVVVVAVAISLWFEFYVLLAVPIVGYAVYVGYHFIQAVSTVLDFLERLRN